MMAACRPATLSCVRKGSPRATVREICAGNAIPHREADLTLGEVYAADEMFCTGTMGELAAVTRVDGRTIGNVQVGVMTECLSQLYAQRTASEGVQVA